jgi:sodium-dependent dicarboxylate transporter 2/3/5
MPILDTICKELKLEKGDKLASTLSLGQMFSCAFSCGMTPIAHIFPVMALGYYQQATGKTISYTSYMAFGIPVGIISFIIMMLLFRFFMNPDMSKLKKMDLSSLKAEIQPMEKREIWILAVFFIVVSLWILPEFVKPMFPSFAAFLSKKGTAFPPMLGAVALFIISVNGKPLLDFKETLTKGIQWGSIFMAGATLALGTAMTNKEVGLTEWLSSSIEPMIANLTPALIILAFIIWAAFMTNVASNMVTVTVVCAVAIPIALSSSGSINAAAIASIIGMIASYAFATPPAHPNVALAIGSGWTTTSQTLKYGTILMVVSIIAAMAVGYPIASAFMV